MVVPGEQAVALMSGKEQELEFNIVPVPVFSALAVGGVGLLLVIGR